MVGYQAVGISFGNRGDVQPILLQKITKVIRLPKHILEPIGMVENVVTGIGCEWNHRLLIFTN